MPAQDFIAQTEPTDIVAELSLSIGTAYSCQNVSTFATLRIREEIATPDATARAFRVEAGGAFQLKPEAGIPIWVWTDDAPCPVILSAQP